VRLIFFRVLYITGKTAGGRSAYWTC